MTSPPISVEGLETQSIDEAYGGTQEMEATAYLYLSQKR
jgi:hypothetical protein